MMDRDKDGLMALTIAGCLVSMLGLPIVSRWADPTERYFAESTAMMTKKSTAQPMRTIIVNNK